MNTEVWTVVSVSMQQPFVEGIAQVLVEMGYTRPLQKEGPDAVVMTASFPGSRSVAEVQSTIARYAQQSNRDGGGVSELHIDCQVIPTSELPEGWRDAYLGPRPIGGAFFIRPAGSECMPDGSRTVIELSRDSAYGTGSSPTTQLCVALLERYLRPATLVVDVGTGSGVLAIVAARLGARAVVALDLELRAVQEARRNAILNGVASRITFLCGDLLHAVRGEPECIVANLNYPLLGDLITEAVQLLREGRLLIVGSVRPTRQMEIVKRSQEAGFCLLEPRQQEQWMALALLRVEAPED